MHTMGDGMETWYDKNKKYKSILPSNNVVLRQLVYLLFKNEKKQLSKFRYVYIYYVRRYISIISEWELSGYTSSLRMIL